MTQAICGSSGVLTGVDGATEIQSWSITQTVDAQNATSMASAGWAENLACLKGATGTVKALHRFETGPYTILASTGTAKYAISGGILVSKVTCDTDVSGIVSWTGDFSFTGKITVANATA